MTLDDVIDRLRSACQDAGTQAAWAADHGFSTSYVSDVVNGRRDPGTAILKALGLEKAPASYRETVKA